MLILTKKQIKMRKYLWIPIVIVAFALMGALKHSEPRKSIRGEGDIVTTTRNVSAFEEIKLEGVYNVYVSQGSSEKVKVEAYENLQDLIICRNKGNKLIIEMEDNKSIKKGEHINLYITVKKLSKIEASIVGKIEFKDVIKTDVFKFDVSGVGKNHLRLDCNQFNANISSVGEIVLEGKCKSANIHQSGVGSLKAFNFITDYLSTSHSGVGSVEVYADKELDVSCSGIGSVYYKGDAEKKTINVSGLGKVRRK